MDGNFVADVRLDDSDEVRGKNEPAKQGQDLNGRIQYECRCYSCPLSRAKSRSYCREL